ncbi:MAG TPA: ABC transporter permease, partial [Candidatus Methylacidiphilales bacterium]
LFSSLHSRYLAPFYRYLHIVLYKTYANLKAENDKTYLGCLWWIAEPLINTAVFYFIFVYILKNRGPDFVVFLYIGMIVYGWFSNGLSAAANSIVSHAPLIQQIWLPKALFPFISVSNISWKFCFSLAAVLPLLWFLHAPLSVAYLALPVLIVVQYLVIVSLGMPLAGVIPYFHDGRTVLSTFLSVFMWLSGVFYGREHVPAHLAPLFYANPAAALIEAYRAVLVYGHWPDWMVLAKSLLLPAVCLFAGLAILRKIDRQVTKRPL